MTDVTRALISHATQKAWANPSQDSQFLLKPAQVNPSYGTRGIFRAWHFTYPVPNTSGQWIIYEYGGIAPRTLGLYGSSMNWRNVNEIMDQENMILYPMINQRMLNFDSVYVTRLDNGNLLFAVDRSRNEELLSSNTELYVRVYSNSYFSSSFGSTLRGIKSQTRHIENDVDIGVFISAYNSTGYEADGQTWWFRNGFVIDKPSVDNISVGDTVQWVWDSSALETFDVPLENFTNFLSTKDGVGKLLLITPEFVNEQFMYFDDVEFFACSKDTNGKTIGCFYDRQLEQHLGQVTHRDWAFDSQRLAEVITQHPEMPYRDAFVRVTLRQVLNREISVGDGQYLNDLYGIDYATRFNILTGGAGTFSQWRASVLENSPFMKWLNRPYSELTEENVKGVYNYYGLQEALQVSEKLEDGWRLPEMALTGCCVVNFDAEGLYHSFRCYTPTEAAGGVHQPIAEVKDIVVVCGLPAESASVLERVIDGNDDVADIFAEERFYKSTSETAWNLAVPGTDYDYNSIQDRVIWAPNRLAAVKAVRSGKYYTVREFTLNYEDLAKPVNIMADGSVPMTGFGFGRVDVWIDGKRLSKGLDYQFDKFELSINAREYMDRTTSPVSNTETLEVFIIAHGIPSDTEDGQFGFVVDNMVNHDTDVDLVRNRNFSLYVKGRKLPHDRAHLAEDYRGNYTVNVDEVEVVEWREGVPYTERTAISYQRAIFVAPLGGVFARAVFDPTEWTRIWTSIPYQLDSTADEHYMFYHTNGKLVQRLSYKDGAVVENGDITDIVPDVNYTAKVGLPLAVDLTNGHNYQFSGPSNVISTFLVGDLSDSFDEARQMSKDLSNYIASVSEQVEVDGVILVPAQHEVVSPFMYGIFNAIKAGQIQLTNTDLTDAAIDYATRDYQYLLAKDPCKQDFDYRYVACFSHPHLVQQQVNSVTASFMARCSEYFFNSRIQTNRDFYIG